VGLLAEDGIVMLFTGQMPHGQGHQTTLAQIAADGFGVPLEQIRVVIGDSDAVPFGLTGSNRSATMTGGVTLHGVRQLKAKVLDVAALLMEASARDLEITDGHVVVRGDPDSAIPVAVDVETGIVKVERCVAAEDCGARSSIPRSSRARSWAVSRRASALCSSSGRPTTKAATTSRHVHRQTVQRRRGRA